MPKRSRMKRFTRKKKGGSPRKLEIVNKRASSPIPPPKIRLRLKNEKETLKIIRKRMNVEPKKTGKLRNWWNKIRGKKEQPVEQIYEKINPLYTSSSSPHSKHLRVGSEEEKYYKANHKKNTPPVYAQLINSNTSSNKIYEKIDSDSDSNSKKTKKSPPPVPPMKWPLPPRKDSTENFDKLNRVVNLRRKSRHSKKRKGMVFEDPFLEDVDVDLLKKEPKLKLPMSPNRGIALG
jgi:hypothetical protein